MDLICNAYSNSSDDEPDSQPKSRPGCRTTIFAPSKRSKPDKPPTFQSEAPIPGRYISKRERALHSQPTPGPSPPIATSPVLGSITDTKLPHEVMASLRQTKSRSLLSEIPKRLSIALSGHTKAVNALNWSCTHAHLLASAGMDQTVCIWNVWNRDQKLARVFKFHNAAVKDVKWSHQGLSIISCGYDYSSRLIDVEKGTEIRTFKEDQVVGVLKFHPDNSNIFLSGGSKGSLRLWDARTGNVVHEYIRGLGSILDVEFYADGKQFISSSDVSGANISENSIIIWDVSRQIPLSNQVDA
ncbi:hypothetical protein K2173_010755 [Erythroxylum novogranatense]|uniref:Uncharacterized protein n=1 Tax=Erythroxylum novogranatense TaxID=1862640 RepID=A0AAV8SRZ5_9ROSI|nr:hypothetical protein K2173_010755 [Erythroxylum novogranatense]